MTRATAATAILLLAAAVLGAEPAQAPPPRPIPLAELVRQLSSEEYAEREAASRRLGAMALDPPPELLAAAKSDDPDLRERAARAAQAMRWNAGATRLPRGRKFAEDGRVDLFVAATAGWDLKPDDRRLWEPALDLGRRLIEKADMKGGREMRGCPSFYDFDEYRRLTSPRFTRVDNVYVRREAESYPHASHNEAIQAPGVADPKAISSNLIISRGSVTARNGIHNSVILADGDISVRMLMFKSVIVCEGDVTITDEHISLCVVVARGNISAAGGAEGSVLMAGGKVRLGKERYTKGDYHNVILEGEPTTLGVKFFELKDTVGVVVGPADGGVKVTNYKLKGAFAAAGVEIDDVITAVNGRKPDSAESLRRLLRDALALGDATVTLKRGEKTETVKVALPD